MRCGYYGRRFLSIVVALLAGAAIRLVAAPSPAPEGLPHVLATLRLTSGGVPEWLDRLAPGARGPGAPAVHERLLVAQAGRIIESRDGSQTHIVFDSSLTALCETPGAGLVLVHNHPNSTGLSADDLENLAQPGVTAVVAIGHDGSIYAAAAGPRFPASQFVDALYGPARAAADRELRARRSPTANVAAASFMPHLMALALQKANVIDYRATLSPDLQFDYARVRVALGAITEAARMCLDRALKGGP
jgi:hypothetical protein